jgi:hypothetical protein
MITAARWLWIGSVMLLSGACGKSASECAAEAKAVGEYLTTMERTMDVVPLGDDWELVYRDDLPAPGDDVQLAPDVAVRPGVLRHQGTDLDAGELGEELAKARAMIVEAASGRWPRRGRIDTELVYLVVDRATPWPEVVAASAAAREAGFTHQAFVLARHPKLPRPPRTSVDDRFDKLIASKPDSIATEAAKIAREITEPCPALTRLFGQVASEEAGDKAAYMANGVEAALRECSCAADPASVRSLMWQIVGTRRPIALVQLDIGVGGGTPVSLPPTATWADAAATLKPGPASFAVETR